MWLANAVRNWEIVCSRWFPTHTLDSTLVPMTEIRFDKGHGGWPLGDGATHGPAKSGSETLIH